MPLLKESPVSSPKISQVGSTSSFHTTFKVGSSSTVGNVEKSLLDSLSYAPHCYVSLFLFSKFRKLHFAETHASQTSLKTIAPRTNNGTPKTFILLLHPQQGIAFF